MKIKRDGRPGRFIVHMLESVGELGSFKPARPHPRPQPSSAAALASDWEKLGQDMRRASGQVIRRAKA